MYQIYNYFKIAFKAESRKKKCTGIYSLSFALGVLSPLILFISRCSGGIRHVPNIPHNLFINFMGNALELFAFYFFPFLIILTTARIAFIDHKDNGWRLMASQPLPKYTYYFSKFSIILISNIITISSFIGFSILFVYTLSEFDIVSEKGVLDLPVAIIFNLLVKLAIASLYLSALQYVISVRFSNFLWPLLIGVLGYGFSTFFNESDILIFWFPYSSISSVFNKVMLNEFGYITFLDYISLLGGTVLLYFGYKLFVYKSIKVLFFGSVKQMIGSVVVLIVSISLYLFLVQEKQYEAHNRTVICGTIESKNPTKMVYLIDPFSKDTIVSVPVENNKFKAIINRNLTLMRYDLWYDNSYRKRIYMGDNDSIMLKTTFMGAYKDTKIYGNRLAGNKYKETEDRKYHFFYVKHMLKDDRYLDNPNLFFARFKKEWDLESNLLAAYRTVNNYKLRNDFLEYEQRKIDIKFKVYFDEYLKKIKLLKPERIVNIPENLKTFTKPIRYNEAFLKTPKYLSYILGTLKEKNTESIDEDSKLLKEIAQLPEGRFKDKLLYYQLMKSINEYISEDDIDKLLTKYLPLISGSKIRQQLIEKGGIVKLLEQGKEAPLFKLETLNGGRMCISDLRGKYLVLDIWASWCGPCKRNAPYFEKYAYEYASERVEFIFVNIDGYRSKWQASANDMSQQIQHLRVINKDEFKKAYNVNSIPRYMIIDPQGKIVSIDAPKPSKSGFEIVLKESLCGS